MMWTGNWDNWGAALLMSLMMLVFWGGLIWMIAYVIRGSSRSGERAANDPSAIRLLEERFARGEIDQDEFEERRRILKSKVA